VVLRVVRLLVLLLGVLSVAAPARADDPGAPFRAKLMMNVAVARRAAAGLAAIAKQSPPRGLPADEKKAWSEHSKALASGSARFAALKGRMDAVLAKGKNAPPSEVAQINMELSTVQQDVEQASSRFESLGAASRTRHQAAMKILR
jgi:hypothetical protein